MKPIFSKVIKDLKRFWHFIWHDDSLLSYVLNFAVAFIFIKFIFFPAIGFVLNNDYPIVAIVSGSMEHKIVEHQVCDKFVADTKKSKLDTDMWWNLCSDYYIKYFNLSKEDFSTYPYQNGLNIGDVMVLYGKDVGNINVGEILVFEPQNREWFESHGPVIHRVVKKWQDADGQWHFQTKGDHNSQSFDYFENDITEDKVIGVAVFRVPYLGWAKLALNNVLLYVRGLV